MNLYAWIVVLLVVSLACKLVAVAMFVLSRNERDGE